MVTTDHLGLSSGAAVVAILTGDSERVPQIAEVFGARHVTSKRGFVCHVASDWRLPLAVVATGIGAPATAIVVEELIDLGVRCLIRIGTCGAIQSYIQPDHLVVPVGCVREDGTSSAYIDASFPALADMGLATALLHAARDTGARVHCGITHCKDAYYSERPGKQPDWRRGARRWRMWRTAHVLATEMETAALFVIASLRRVPAAAIFVNVGRLHSSGFDRALTNATQASAAAILTVLEAGLFDTVQPDLRDDPTSYLSHGAHRDKSKDP